ncbi:MAG: TIM barrel protein [Candidatus Omnitrophota bacterium]
MFSLSTAWNAQTAQDAKTLISQIQVLGFKNIELSFTLSRAVVAGIARLKRSGGFEISSVHNFCPLPDGIAAEDARFEAYSLSAIKKDERRKAKEATKKTIRMAKKLGAKVVVLHLGKVDIKDRTMRLYELMNKGEDIGSLRGQFMEERRSKAGEHLDVLYDSLDEVADFAVRNDIKLGIENRYRYKAMPIFEEIGPILEDFKKKNVYYWHDTGHAQVFEFFGYNKHADFLDAFSDRMIGVHLHDITGIHDHKAPLTGKMDFNMLTPYLKKNTIKVLEPHSGATGIEVKRGFEYLKGLYKDE